MSLSVNAQRILDVRSDFATFAETCLKISDKRGELVPLILNDAQRYIHAKLEAQLAATGKVRAVVLKGRQQGASTYIQARFYHKITGSFGRRAFIMTHEDPATENLFRMTKRYNDNAPPAFKPRVRFDNAKELHFDALDSKYSVATAGSKATGRSATAQYLHGSEVAFWPNAAGHMAGIGQVVPDEPDTEIILESTAYGIGNTFHQKWLDAVDGRGEYIAIFVPWFWQREYRKTCPPDVEFSKEEIEYQHAFDLDNEQLFWRRLKIVDDFGSDETLFNQEYPATAETAFMAGTKDSFISPLVVAEAHKKKGSLLFGATVIGVDPAEYGDDDTSIVIRKGLKVLRILRYHGENGEQIAGRVALLIEEYEPDAVCVDSTGVGTAVELFLTQAGHVNIHRIHNGSAAIEKERFVNRACEMWWRMNEWLKDAACYLPKDARLQTDLVGRKYDYDPSRRFRLETKEQMKKRGLKSPDSADALSLTFAVSIKPRVEEHKETLMQKLARIRGTSTSGNDDGMTA